MQQSNVHWYCCLSAGTLVLMASQAAWDHNQLLLYTTPLHDTMSKQATRLRLDSSQHACLATGGGHNKA